MMAALAVLLVAGATWSWWTASSVDADIVQRAGRGLDRLGSVERFPSEGAAHLRPGTRASYRTNPPTSGPHDSVPTRPGVYSDVQPPEKLVHSLEHGNIVIYVDRPDAAVMQTLKSWADHYTGQWDGVIVTPLPGLGQAVVLTAWQHRLRLAEFDADAAAAFIDRFRGRGPEHPVR